MQPVGIENIKVDGEIGRRIEITAKNNILASDMENDFISPFRGDWDFRKQGDFIGLGKMFDAITRLAHYMNDPQMTALRRHTVDEIVKMQGEDGYIGLMKPQDRLKYLWDIGEIADFIICLLTDYEYWKEEKCLKAAIRLADYMMDAWMKNPADVPEGIFPFSTDADYAYLLLYEHTSDGRYLNFVKEHIDAYHWDKEIVVGRWGDISGHVYNYFDKTIAHMKALELSGKDPMSETVRRLLDFILHQDGMVVSGETGEYECWDDTQEGTRGLGETCATVFFLFFLDAVLKSTGGAVYGDMMERAIYNGLFAAQSPDGRRIRYYTSFEGPRGYFNYDIYCCPPNYRRGVSRLPEMIYYLDGEGLAVNLYTESDATFTLESGLTLTVSQKTDYPRSGSISLRIDPAHEARFPVKLRIPGWCESATVTVNNEAAASAEKGRFFEIDRVWRPGDTITLAFSMPFRFVRGRKRQFNKVAVMRGPQVFCLNPALNPGLAGEDIREVIINTASLNGPFDDRTIPGGQACEIDAWMPKSDHFHEQATVHYPGSRTNIRLRLTEFADPGCEAVYFKVPNPCSAELKDDELIQAELKISGGNDARL